MINGVWSVPVHCMNCGDQHGYCNESATEPGGGYVGFLCDRCAETWSPLVGTMLIPDQVHWQKVPAAQGEPYGRVLSPFEQAAALRDGSTVLAKLARDR